MNSTKSGPPYLASDATLRRALNIPKDQRDLLNRKDSWASELRHGSPGLVNLPPLILENFRTSLRTTPSYQSESPPAPNNSTPRGNPSIRRDTLYSSPETFPSSWSESPPSHLRPSKQQHIPLPPCSPVKNVTFMSSQRPEISPPSNAPSCLRSPSPSSVPGEPVRLSMVLNSRRRHDPRPEADSEVEDFIQTQDSFQVSPSPVVESSAPQPRRKVLGPQDQATCPSSGPNVDSANTFTVGGSAVVPPDTPPSAQVIPCTEPSQDMKRGITQIPRRKCRQVDWDTQLLAVEDEDPKPPHGAFLMGRATLRDHAAPVPPTIHPYSSKKPTKTAPCCRASTASTPCVRPAALDDHPIIKPQGIDAHMSFLRRALGKRLGENEPLSLHCSLSDSSALKVAGEEASSSEECGGRSPAANAERESSLSSVCRAWNSSCSNSPYVLYRLAYKDHNGSLLDFIRACVNLGELRSNRRLPSFLYDDFIRAFSGGYLDYIQTVPVGSQGTLTAVEWYNDNCEQPLYLKGIITKANLILVLGQYPDEVQEAERLLDSPGVEDLPGPFNPVSLRPAVPSTILEAPMPQDVPETRNQESTATKNLSETQNKSVIPTKTYHNSPTPMVDSCNIPRNKTTTPPFPLLNYKNSATSMDVDINVNIPLMDQSQPPKVPQTKSMPLADGQKKRMLEDTSESKAVPRYKKMLMTNNAPKLAAPPQALKDRNVSAVSRSGAHATEHPSLAPNRRSPSGSRPSKRMDNETKEQRRKRFLELMAMKGRAKRVSTVPSSEAKS